MFSRKFFFAGFILWAVLIEILSHILVDSINPIKIFYLSNNLLAKIAIGVMMFFGGMSIIQFLALSTSYADRICPICEKNLVKFIPVYGKAKICFACFKAGRDTQYHDKCFKAKGNCPICEQENPWDV
ncbi:hypothetical protein [Candidatus Magnetomonas plexicatena]|uniref:hypothetical protein n=1 Tax=Candidatus Magnetomonas plexicatena TaxID=2552947 RepID=UPI001C75BE6C|nr:hypothetical protein E2O03_001755 [Nitrospirales bacterium LBB_01]